MLINNECNESIEQHTTTFPFQCSLCILNFANRTERNDHIKQHFKHKSCAKCTKSLIQIGDEWYQLHTDEKCNQEKDPLPDQNENTPISISNSKSKFPVHCSLLNDQNVRETNFIPQAAAFTTTNSVHEFEEVIIKSEDSDTAIEMPEDWDINSEFQSNLSYDDDVDYGLLRSVSEENEYKGSFYECQICHTVTTTKASLKRHIEGVHEGKFYSCDVCGKTYKQKQTLNIHKATFHTDNDESKSVLNVLLHEDTMNAELVINYDENAGNRSGSFKCDVCHRTTSTKRSLKRHVEEVHEGKSYACVVCGKSYRRKQRMNIHMVTWHGSNDKSTIGIETPIESLESGTNHAAEANARDTETRVNSLECKICHKTSSTQGSLKRHIESVHKGTRYTCDICGRTYSYKDKLKAHRTFHFEVSKEATMEQPKAIMIEKSLNKIIKTTKPTEYVNSAVENDTEQTIENGSRIFECNICHKIVSTQGSLKRHIESIHEGKIYGCEICGKIYAHKHRLVVHKSSHSDEQRVTCDICNRQFTHKELLIKHMFIHGSGRKHTCEQCNKSFRLPENLRMHMKIVHEGKSLFKCDICGKDFMNKGNLKTHQVVHSDERAFICNYCGRGFNAKHNFTEHMNTHMEERPYVCELCGKTFKQDSLLRAHTRVHTKEKPYKCKSEGCSRAYANGTDLKRHRYNVHGICSRPYACPICPKIFGENKSLKKHLESHNMMPL